MSHPPRTYQWQDGSIHYDPEPVLRENCGYRDHLIAESHKRNPLMTEQIILKKKYEGLPILKNLPWYAKWLTYLASIVLFTKFGMWLGFTVGAPYAAFPIMIIGSLSVLHLLGPPKEDRENPRIKFL